LEDQSWTRNGPTTVRKYELLAVGRRERTKTRSLSPSEMNATWTASVEEQISKLLELPPDWDTYGASSIRIDAVDALIKVLRDVMYSTTPPPTIVPVADGHLQAEWHTHGVDLEVEVVDPLQIDVYYSGPNGEWNDVLGVDLSRLTAALDQMS
jgi:hypothetical protein